MHAIRTVRRSLKVIDDSGDGVIDRVELQYGFRNVGIYLEPQIIEGFFLGLDADKSGFLSIEGAYVRPYVRPYGRGC